MRNDPYLSVVVTSRNDDHGGSMLRRMQIMVSSLIEQCRRFDFDCELIVVEWNPPPGPRLSDVLNIDLTDSPLQIRFVEVPESIHAQVPNGEKLRLFQMIAKNVGIRRAKGKFVLATNIDIILNDELMDFLTQKQLEEDAIYRIDRWDAGSDVPVNSSIKERLLFCENNLIRVNKQKATYAWPLAEEEEEEREDAIESARQKHTDELEQKLARKFVVPLFLSRALDRVSNLSRESDPLKLSWMEVRRNELLKSMRHLWYLYRYHTPAGFQGFIRKLIPASAGKRLFDDNFYAVFVHHPIEGMVLLLESPIRAFADAAQSVALATTDALDAFSRAIQDLIFRGTKWRQDACLSLAQATKSVILSLKKNIGRENETKAIPSARVDLDMIRRSIHTNACGDFTLMSRKWWDRLNAYIEYPIFSFHIDSILCVAAFLAGLKEIILEDPMRVYHIEHGQGWTPEANNLLFSNLTTKELPFLNDADLNAVVKQMGSLPGPSYYGHRDWGFPNDVLPELVLFQNNLEAKTATKIGMLQGALPTSGS